MFATSKPYVLSEDDKKQLDDEITRIRSTDPYSAKTVITTDIPKSVSQIIYVTSVGNKAIEKFRSTITYELEGHYVQLYEGLYKRYLGIKRRAVWVRNFKESDMFTKIDKNYELDQETVGVIARHNRTYTNDILLTIRDHKAAYTALMSWYKSMKASDTVRTMTNVNTFLDANTIQFSLVCSKANYKQSTRQR